MILDIFVKHYDEHATYVDCFSVLISSNELNVRRSNVQCSMLDVRDKNPTIDNKKGSEVTI
jgi:hypothetical protein